VAIETDTMRQHILVLNARNTLPLGLDHLTAPRRRLDLEISALRAARGCDDRRGVTGPAPCMTNVRTWQRASWL